VRPPHCVPPRFVLPALAIAAIVSTPASLLAQFPQGPEFRVNTYTTDSPGYFLPDVAADSSGSFVVVWHRGDPQDGSGHGVFGQRYSQMVPVELMHFGIE